MPGTQPLAANAPASAQRKLIAMGVVAFLVSQVLIPASYYWKGEPTSERFAWRMFSSVDLCTWNTKVVKLVEHGGHLIEQEEPMHATLQETYVKLVQRAQFDIVEPYLRVVAEQDGVREVRFEAQGTLPSGALMPPIRLSLKPGGRLVKLSN